MENYYVTLHQGSAYTIRAVVNGGVIKLQKLSLKTSESEYINLFLCELEEVHANLGQAIAISKELMQESGS